jgi:4-hydroxy-3-polyprenylbenzoate decarboxylase
MPFTNAAAAWNAPEEAGVPRVRDIHIPWTFCGTNIIVHIRPTYRGQAKHVAAALWGTKAAEWFYKIVIVVEEDIDFRNPGDLDWPLAYRVNAGEGDVVIYGPTNGSLLDPSTRQEERDTLTYGSGKWYRVLIDATNPR